MRSVQEMMRRAAAEHLAAIGYRDPPLCPVCKVNHVGWWVTSKGQHFDPYCAACGFEPTDQYRADIDPVFRDGMLRRAIERNR